MARKNRLVELVVVSSTKSNVPFGEEILVKTGDQSARLVVASTTQVRFSPPDTRNLNAPLLVVGIVVTRMVRNALRRLSRPPVRHFPASEGSGSVEVNRRVMVC